MAKARRHLLLAVVATALVLIACRGSSSDAAKERADSGAAESSEVSRLKPRGRTPTDAALQVAFEPGTTSTRLEGTLDAGKEAEFVVGAEAGSILVASVVGLRDDLTTSVYRMDTGEEITDTTPDPSFWIARLPESIGYLVVLHGADLRTDYTLTIGNPRERSFEELSSDDVARVDAPGISAREYSTAGRRISVASRCSHVSADRRRRCSTTRGAFVISSGSRRDNVQGGPLAHFGCGLAAAAIASASRA